MHYDESVRNRIVARYTTLKAKGYSHLAAYYDLLKTETYRGCAMNLQKFITRWGGDTVRGSENFITAKPQFQSYCSQITRLYPRGTKIEIRVKKPGDPRATVYNLES